MRQVSDEAPLTTTCFPNQETLYL